MAGRTPPELGAEFRLRVHAAIERYGLAFERKPLLEEFQDRGVSRPTVFRWIKAAERSAPKKAKLKAGKKAEPAALPVVVADPPAAVAAPPTVAVPPALVADLPAAVDDIAGKLPDIPRVEGVTAKGLLPVVELLRECISHAQDLVKHARERDGAVRNARLLMQASEHLRRSIDTAAKLNETVAVQRDMERFHDTVMEEIGLEAPAVQQRILDRLRRAADAVLIDA